MVLTHTGPYLCCKLLRRLPVGSDQKWIQGHNSSNNFTIQATGIKGSANQRRQFFSKYFDSGLELNINIKVSVLTFLKKYVRRSPFLAC